MARIVWLQHTPGARRTWSPSVPDDIIVEGIEKGLYIIEERAGSLYIVFAKPDEYIFTVKLKPTVQEPPGPAKPKHYSYADDPLLISLMFILALLVGILLTLVVSKIIKRM